MVRVFSAPRLFQSPPRLSESAPVTLAVKFEASLVVAAFLDRVGNLESAPPLWRHRSTSRSADGRGYFLASAKTRQWPSSLFGRFFFSRETPPRAESQGSRNSARRRDPGGSDPPSSRDTAPFPPRAVLPRMDVGKILSRGGVTTVDFSRGGPTVTKFHCTNSKLREKRFSAKKWSGKYQISKPKGRPRPPLQPLSDVHVSAAVFLRKTPKKCDEKVDDKLLLDQRRASKVFGVVSFAGSWRSVALQLSPMLRTSLKAVAVPQTLSCGVFDPSL